MAELQVMSKETYIALDTPTLNLSSAISGVLPPLSLGHTVDFLDLVEGLEAEFRRICRSTGRC